MANDFRVNERGMEDEEKPSFQVIEEYLDAAKKQQRGRLWAIYSQSGRVLDIMKWQLLLNDSLLSLSNPVYHSQEHADDALSLVLDALRGASVIQDHLIDILGWDPLKTLPSHESARKAVGVFEIPELAEMILCLLPIRDLMVAPQVSKAFAAAVDSSLKIQTILGTEPNGNGFWSTNFAEDAYGTYSLGWFKCDIVEDGLIPVPEEDGYRVNASLDLKVARERGELLRLPACSRYRSMLLCQPPIYEMQAKPNCCGENNYNDSPHFPPLPQPQSAVLVRSDTGLTLGNVLDVATRLSEEHRWCPYAHSEQHDRYTGEVVLDSIELTGLIQLRSDDPLIGPVERSPAYSPHRREDSESYDGNGYRNTKEDRWIDEYVKAKAQACIEGKPIPTFADFQGAHEAAAQAVTEEPEDDSDDVEATEDRIGDIGVGDVDFGPHW